MTQEEKAKRFDEIFVKARKYYDEYKTRDNILYVEDMEDMFPEFKENESDDERIRKDCLKYLDWEYHRCSHDEDKIKIEKCIEWLEKRGEQKSTEWSEDDENKINSIKYLLHELDNHNFDNWFKSLKERVQPQQKQEWSEKDKQMSNIITSDVLKIRQKCGIGTDEWNIRSEALNWFKSIRPQSQWKPSEFDIRILEQVIDGTANPINYHATLHAVLEKLKKLREE